MVTSKICGAEALARWIHPIDGIRMPSLFIPVFEQTGFILELDMYMFEEVCRIKADWKEQKKAYADLGISVNMSRLHLHEGDFCEALCTIADKYNIPHNELEIEVTESVFEEDNNVLIENVNRIKEHGFLVSIDDFGSGFSALNLLKDLYMDTIKIDRGFIHGSGETARGKSIIRNVITLCMDLKVDVLTEGIETKEQAEFIMQCGCQIAQGFYYSKPLPLAEFEIFAQEYYKAIISCYEFPLNGDLKSRDGSMEGTIVGEGLIFQDGISPNTKSLYFPGGEQGHNVLSFPEKAIVGQSYTISLWMKPERLLPWACALYIRHDIGFATISPLAWDNSSNFRIWNSIGVGGWYDVPAPRIETGVWTNYAIVYNAKLEIMKAYINGIPVGSVENVPTNRHVEQFVLGGDAFKPSFCGNLCELVIYNEAKDDLFIKQLYDSYVS
ncbi:MAG: EAL domain-containing protein [Lachnospiraceae bacterium]|nr:EAL domain-containing protein [Lachnospiraceae bacterium]